MKKSKSTEEQIAYVLRRVEGGCVTPSENTSDTRREAEYVSYRLPYDGRGHA